MSWMRASAVGLCRKTPDTARTRAGNCQATGVHPCVMDLETAAKLWQPSEKLTGVKFAFQPVGLMAETYRERQQRLSSN